MKNITKVLISTFSGATAITGVVAGTAIPVLYNQSSSVQTQTVTSSNNSDGQDNINPVAQPNLNNGDEIPPVTSPSEPENNNPEQNSTESNQQDNNNKTATSFTASDYQQLFENANSEGLANKKGTFKDLKDLSNDPQNPNYFAKYYDLIIPEELSNTGVTITPKNFEIKGNDVANFNYHLETKNQQISIPVTVTVHGFYQYPAYNKNQIINNWWKPQNYDFLKANLATNIDQETFDQFVVDHWNDSFLGDAINTYRFYYFINKDKTTDLQKYIHRGFFLPGSNWQDRRVDWSIGYLMASSYSVPSNPNLAGDLVNIPNWTIPGGYSGIKINPIFDSEFSFDKNNVESIYKWEIRNFHENNIHNSASGNLGSYLPFTVYGKVKLNFKNVAPVMKYDSNRWMKIAKIDDVTVEAFVNNYNPHVSHAWKSAKIKRTESFSILQALFRYFKTGETNKETNIKAPFYNLFDTVLSMSV